MNPKNAQLALFFYVRPIAPTIVRSHVPTTMVATMNRPLVLAMTSFKPSGLKDAFENTANQARQAMFGPGSKQIITGGTFTINQSLGLIEPGK